MSKKVESKPKAAFRNPLHTPNTLVVQDSYPPLQKLLPVWSDKDVPSVDSKKEKLFEDPGKVGTILLSLHANNQTLKRSTAFVAS